MPKIDRTKARLTLLLTTYLRLVFESASVPFTAEHERDIKALVRLALDEVVADRIEERESGRVPRGYER